MNSNGQNTRALQDEIMSLRQEVETLRQNQTLLNGIINAIPAGVVAKDTQGRYLFVNTHAANSINRAPAEILGKTDIEIRPSDEATAAIEREQHVIRTGQPTEREITMTLAGGVRTILATNFPLFDEQGNVFAVGGLGNDISERKRVETELREQQEMLAFVLEGSRDGAWDWKFPTNDVIFSDRYREILGYRPDELPASVEAWIDNIHPEDLPRVQQHLQDYLEGRNENYAIEHRMRRKNGDWQWMLSRGKVVMRDENGAPLRMTGTVTDISEQKRQENELRMFKALVENALDAIAVVQADIGEITYINNAYRQMYRCGDDHIGQSIAVIVAEEDQQQLPKVLEAIATEGVWTGTLTHVRQDGETFPASESCFVVRDDDDKVQYMVGAVRDISEQKRQENEIRIFKTMADTSPDAFGMANKDGTLTYANEAYRTLTGYGDALVGMNFMDHFTADERPLALEALKTTAELGTWRGILNFARRDGSTVPVEATGFVARDDEGNITAVIGLFRDLTERRREEAERQALQEQVIDAQRAALRELSTPLIPVSDEVVIMPLIGTIDTGRAQQVMETLLEGVARYQATLAILDITGVSVVDTQVAQALISAAQAVRLLGAKVMLTGIQPQIAQTLVHLGVDLGSVETRGSLQSGIAYALRNKMRQ